MSTQTTDGGEPAAQPTISMLEAEIAAYREALELARQEGGWRLFYYENAGPASEAVWDRSDTFNVRLRSREEVRASMEQS